MSVRESGDIITVDIRAASEVDHAREMLEFEVDRFLRSRGWNHTSDTPGCYWLWEKAIDGRTLLVSKEYALRYEEQNEPSDEDEVEG